MNTLPLPGETNAGPVLRLRILVVAPYYAPDLGPSAPLFTMLCTALAERGHQVTVIAAVPHYPSGQVPAEYRGRGVLHSSEDGVEVIRVPVPSVERVRLRQRLLQFLAYQLGATWAGRGRDFDAVLVANPALWTGLPFACLAVLRHRPAIFSVHDVYPDVGVKLGIFRQRGVIAAVARLEQYCLNHAAVVRILSDSFRPALHDLGVPDDKLALVYDWVDTEFVQPLPRDNEFACEHGLLDRFVVLYAGNIGLSQGLEHVLTAAQLLSHDEHLLFVFVGDGTGRERLMEEAAQRQLANVRFLPFQPRARLPQVLATADVGLVSLQHGIGFGSLPSKTFSILASSRPVIAMVDEGSETWNLVQRAEAGLCLPPEAPELLAQAIVTLARDPQTCRNLGINGRRWAECHHSARSAAKEFEKLILRAVAVDSRPQSKENVL
jgi:colanic acid biosynthesis glycosyl transferase WcaI